jgi:hypothetical protein
MYNFKGHLHWAAGVPKEDPENTSFGAVNLVNYYLETSEYQPIGVNTEPSNQQGSNASINSSRSIRGLPPNVTKIPDSAKRERKRSHAPTDARTRTNVVSMYYPISRRSSLSIRDYQSSSYSNPGQESQLACHTLPISQFHIPRNSRGR